MEGTIKFFDKKKGFGFLTDEEGNDRFLHFSSILKEGFKTLLADQRVSFEPGENEKGKTAINIKVIDE